LTDVTQDHKDDIKVPSLNYIEKPSVTSMTDL